MRTTIHIDSEIGKMAKQVAKTERRNFSNLVEVALAAYTSRTPAEVEAAAELRALGVDPCMALRDKLAEVQRDQFLSAQQSGN